MREEREEEEDPENQSFICVKDSVFSENQVRKEKTNEKTEGQDSKEESSKKDIQPEKETKPFLE